MRAARPLSPRNSRLARLRRLTQRRAYRREEGAFVIEGPTLVADALAAGLPLTEVFVADTLGDDSMPALLDGLVSAGIPIWTVFADALAGAVDVVTPQPVAAIATIPPSPSPEAVAGHDLVVVLAGIGDPGNAGTLVRTAEAAGVGAVLFTNGSVDPFAPKCVRASAGSIFRTPLTEGVATVPALQELRSSGHLVACTRADALTPYDALDYTGPVTFLLGSEAHGVPGDIAAFATDAVSIPMAGQVESLNVAVAGAVLCFEACRQRRRASGAA